MYVVQLSVIFRCAGQITRRFCLQLSPDSQHVDISCVNQGTLKAWNKGSSSSSGGSGEEKGAASAASLQRLINCISQLSDAVSCAIFSLLSRTIKKSTP